MKLTIHDDATVEAVDHVAWYRQREPRVADRLAELFVSTVVRIAQKPLSFPRLEYSRGERNIRRARLAKFPIIIIYEVLEDQIDVLAIAHTSQRPGYWRSRLRSP